VFERLACMSLLGLFFRPFHRGRMAQQAGAE
jgi:hypothetical protein